MTWRKGLAGLGLALLAACNSSGETNPVIGLAARFIPAVGNIPGVDVAQPEAAGFTSSDIAANPGGFVLMHVAFLGDPVLARRIADNGGNETWLAQNGFSASYVDGILVATRGLGEDILASNATGIRAAIRAGGGTGQRVRDRIDDLNQIQQDSFECTITAGENESINLGLRQVETQKYAEVCRGTRLQFENSYWVDDSGEIVTSLQFVAQEVGYLRRSSL